MKPPDEDIGDRRMIWEHMQVFWMDTDPAFELPFVARICAESNYTIEELEAIFWNEVRPAVVFNVRQPIPEWKGFTFEWLKARILEKSRYGKPLPRKWFHSRDAKLWNKLKNAILDYRSGKMDGWAKTLKETWRAKWEGGGFLHISGMTHRFPNDFSTASLIRTGFDADTGAVNYQIAFNRDKEPYCDKDGVGSVHYIERALPQGARYLRVGLPGGDDAVEIKVPG